MSESEWLSCDDPGLLLEEAAKRLSARKCRLSLCGCLRAPAIWTLLTTPASRRATEIGEAFADGAADLRQLGEARHKANAVAGRAWRAKRSAPAAYLANYACLQDRNLRSFSYLPSGCLRQLRGPIDRLRDVFGNPFQPPAFAPEWRTEAVVGLATGAYTDHAFDRLPVLADALEDAGCADPNFLAHCRGDGPHVRGCWVVDLVLGRE